MCVRPRAHSCECLLSGHAAAAMQAFRADCWAWVAACVFTVAPLADLPLPPPLRPRTSGAANSGGRGGRGGWNGWRARRSVHGLFGRNRRGRVLLQGGGQRVRQRWGVGSGQWAGIGGEGGDRGCTIRGERGGVICTSAGWWLRSETSR